MAPTASGTSPSTGTRFIAVIHRYMYLQRWESLLESPWDGACEVSPRDRGSRRSTPRSKALGQALGNRDL